MFKIYKENIFNSILKLRKYQNELKQIKKINLKDIIKKHLDLAGIIHPDDRWYFEDELRRKIERIENIDYKILISFGIEMDKYIQNQKHIQTLENNIKEEKDKLDID